MRSFGIGLLAVVFFFSLVSAAYFEVGETIFLGNDDIYVGELGVSYVDEVYFDIDEVEFREVDVEERGRNHGDEMGEREREEEGFERVFERVIEAAREGRVEVDGEVLGGERAEELVRVFESSEVRDCFSEGVCHMEIMSSFENDVTQEFDFLEFVSAAPAGFTFLSCDKCDWNKSGVARKCIADNKVDYGEKDFMIYKFRDDSTQKVYSVFLPEHCYKGGKYLIEVLCNGNMPTIKVKECNNCSGGACVGGFCGDSILTEGINPKGFRMGTTYEFSSSKPDGRYLYFLHYPKLKIYDLGKDGVYNTSDDSNFTFDVSLSQYFYTGTSTTGTLENFVMNDDGQFAFAFYHFTNIRDYLILCKLDSSNKYGYSCNIFINTTLTSSEYYLDMYGKELGWVEEMNSSSLNSFNVSLCHCYANGINCNKSCLKYEVKNSSYGLFDSYRITDKKSYASYFSKKGEKRLLIYDYLSKKVSDFSFDLPKNSFWEVVSRNGIDDLYYFNSSSLFVIKSIQNTTKTTFPFLVNGISPKGALSMKISPIKKGAFFSFLAKPGNERIFDLFFGQRSFLNEKIYFTPNKNVASLHPVSGGGLFVDCNYGEDIYYSDCSSMIK